MIARNLVKPSVRISALSFCAVFLTSVSALASQPAPPPPAPAPIKKAELPGLTGNKLPQCPEGQYVASMICKVAAPGYYLEHGMKYPAPCPNGMSSPAGAKAKSYCYRDN